MSIGIPVLTLLSFLALNSPSTAKFVDAVRDTSPINNRPIIGVEAAIKATAYRDKIVLPETNNDDMNFVPSSTQIFIYSKNFSQSFNKMTFLLPYFPTGKESNLSGYDALTFNGEITISVLTQEISHHLNTKYPEKYNSYLAASYVKFIEGAGGRVVPIWIGKDLSYYEDIISKINGVLWPGGSSSFDESNGYADAGNKIYKIATRINKQGDYFPIFGTCLGFELLTYITAYRVKHTIDCNCQGVPLPLEFAPEYNNSRMFKDAPRDVVNILKNENVTANYHKYCVTEKSLEKLRLKDPFRILSLNHDLNGIKFISALESVNLPFYGVQFHPEKNIYEWITGKRVPHGKRATRVSQYFADFFVNEARKNGHKFQSTDEESRSLIYNYPATYTGLKGSAFVQCYLFTNADTMIH